MTEPRPRKPWLAAVLSGVVAPGLGQLYNGRVAKFLTVLFGFPIAYVALVGAALRAGAMVPMLAGAYALIAAGWVIAVADAYRDAKHAPAAPPPWYTRWPALVAVALLTVFMLTPLWTLPLVRSAVQAYRLPAGSMEPTLLIGDHLLMDATAYGIGHVPR